jgi:hypothetical protein
MRTPFYLLGLAVVLPACAQHALPQQPTSIKQVPMVKPRPVSTIPIHTLPHDTALVFQRTLCYGTCPSYTATIFRDGRVEYVGERFVPLLGARRDSLPQATVTAMLDEARRINFTALQSRYTSNVSDLPSTIIAVYLPGRRVHRVEATQGMPDNLKGYIAYLRDRIDPLAGLNATK